MGTQHIYIDDEDGLVYVCKGFIVACIPTISSNLRRASAQRRSYSNPRGRMTAALHVPRTDDSVSSVLMTPRNDTPVARDLNPDKREDAHEVAFINNSKGRHRKTNGAVYLKD